MQNKANSKTEDRKQKAEDRRKVIRITGNQDEGYQQTRQSGRIALITRYPDNHGLVTRCSDAH